VSTYAGSGGRLRDRRHRGSGFLAEQRTAPATAIVASAHHIRRLVFVLCGMALPAVVTDEERQRPVVVALVAELEIRRGHVCALLRDARIAEDARCARWLDGWLG